ncbi:MAG: Asp-tRNA(Asn)/Glu-tRNA(Gln) amidotransferase GatCAB subunit A [Bacteroidetes bacterium SW_10_40_5]|nr:MAG: Asp-tRNA(Asn)/Glu-tRNA(Gln) amidotransferase GatCAB subunit A [Bacteroidetes bacterium SW_10_40_5]
MKSYRKLSEVQEDLKRGITNCRQVVEGYLTNINDRKNLNAFLEVYREEALEQADQIDQKLANNQGGRLAGLVIGIKDNICYKGHQVSVSSKILEGFESLYNATAVERLLQQDAIVIGRLNCDEFAMGSSNENSAYGVVKNPRDEEKVPGGSSGGSAAAVAADLCLATLGTDTGGSIRQPASFCGTVGFKPTYGRVSRYGLIAYGSSFDQIGPLTHSVEDAARIMEIIAGKDEYDGTSLSESVPNYSSQLSINKPVQFAYLNDCLEAKGLDPEIKDRINTTLTSLEKQGHHTSEAEFPYLDYVVPTYQILSNAEASSNLSRYDGILYGYRSPNAENLEETLLKSRTEGFGEEVKRRIVLGTFVLSEGYYEAYYSKAQKIRRLIHENLSNILKDNDCIILPTTPGTAFEIGKKTEDPISMYLEDIFTVKANLAGFPSISLPLGEHSNGLPYGIQIIGNLYEEDMLFKVSKHLMDNF